MPRPTLPFLYVLFGILYFLGAFWGMPSALTPASDSIAPLGPLAFVAKYRQADITYIYPAVHQLVQVAAYAVVLLAGKLMGAVGSISGTWPHGFRDPSGMFAVLLVTSNAISAAMAALLLRAMWRMRPSPEAAQWFAVPLLGLSGVYAYYARTANMDIPYLFWIVLAWRQLWLYFTESGGDRRLWLAGLFSALSVGSKDQAAGVVLGFGILLVLCGEGGWKARLRQSAIYTLAVLLCYALVAIAPQPWRWWHHAKFVTSDHVAAETPPTLDGYIELLVRCYWRLHHVFTHAGLPLAAAGIAVLWRAGRRRELMLLLTPAVAYFFFIVVAKRSTEERYMLPIAIPLILCAGAAVGAIRRTKFAAAVGASILVCQLVFSFAPMTYCQIFDAKSALAVELGSLVPPGTPIALHGIPTFNYPNRAVYDNYKLMLFPGNQIMPASTHAANLLHPYDEQTAYVFTGRAEPPPEGRWRLAGSWTYPVWIRSHIHVPATYELFLYRRQ